MADRFALRSGEPNSTVDIAWLQVKHRAANWTAQTCDMTSNELDAVNIYKRRLSSEWIDTSNGKPKRVPEGLLDEYRRRYADALEKVQKQIANVPDAKKLKSIHTGEWRGVEFIEPERLRAFEKLKATVESMEEDLQLIEKVLEIHAAHVEWKRAEFYREEGEAEKRFTKDAIKEYTKVVNALNSEGKDILKALKDPITCNPNIIKHPLMRYWVGLGMKDLDIIVDFLEDRGVDTSRLPKLNWELPPINERRKLVEGVIHRRLSRFETKDRNPTWRREGIRLKKKRIALQMREIRHHELGESLHGKPTTYRLLPGGKILVHAYNKAGYRVLEPGYLTTVDFPEELPGWPSTRDRWEAVGQMESV